MTLKGRVVAAAAASALFVALGASAVAAQTTSSSTTTSSPTTSTTTVPVPEPDTTAACPQPYQPVGWSFGGPGGVNSTGFVEPISGVVTTSQQMAPTVPTPPGFTPFPGGAVIEIPGSGTYSIFLSPAASPGLTVWLINDLRTLPFSAPDVLPSGSVPPRFRAVDTGAGVYVELSSDGRIGSALYRWRFDDPCGGVPATAAIAVAGSPVFTG